jgi:hypothetical protein
MSGKEVTGNRGQNTDSAKTGNRGQNTDSAKILEQIVYGLFFLYTWAPCLTRTYLSFAHTLDFVFEVLSAQYPFLVQGFTNGMDWPYACEIILDKYRDVVAPRYPRHYKADGH